MRLALSNLCRSIYLSRAFIKSHFKRRAFVELNWHVENFCSLYLIRRDMREVRIDLDVELSSHQLQKTGSNLFAVLVYQAVRLYFEFSSLQLSYL